MQEERIVEDKNIDTAENSIPIQLKENKTAIVNERSKSTKVSIICTSLAFALTLVFSIIVILYAINLNNSSGASAIGNALSFVILLIYAGSAIAAISIGLCVASIVTSSIAIKSSNPKNKKIAIATLILSILLMLATIACGIYVLLNV